MTRLRTTLALLLAAVVPMAGCASMSGTQKGAVVGGAAGAAAGAAIGRATGSTARGAIIGAALGGVAGAVIGRQMDKQADELENQLEGATVERYGEGLLITFASGLLFDFDSDVVKGNAQTNLGNLARSLENYPNTDVLIVGHTDATGTDAYNQALSQRRAASAKAFLVSRGVPADRIRTEGRGESEPVASNDTAEGQARNRRVEVAIFADQATRDRLVKQYGGGSS
jgi:outer membrane protein OmpA-like peptidoglycan-associated protein